jgi:hypothetical protein
LNPPEKAMRQTRTKTIQEEIVVCDRCGREMVPDGSDCEHQERIAIRFRAGYGSVFGDGNLVEADLCQHCLQEVLGKYLRITEEDKIKPQHEFSGQASRAYSGIPVAADHRDRKPPTQPPQGDAEGSIGGILKKRSCPEVLGVGAWFW